MSNQVFRNEISRYFPLKKQNTYFMNNDVVITDVTPTNLEYDIQLTDEIGTGLTYVGGIFTIANVSAEGEYTFNFVVTWATNSVGFRIVWGIRNTEIVRRGLLLSVPVTANFTSQSVSITSSMKLGDTFKIQVEQTSGGGNLNVIGAVTSSSNRSNLQVNLIQ